LVKVPFLTISGAVKIAAAFRAFFPVAVFFGQNVAGVVVHVALLSDQ